MKSPCYANVMDAKNASYTTPETTIISSGDIDLELSE